MAVSDVRNDAPTRDFSISRISDIREIGGLTYHFFEDDAWLPKFTGWNLVVWSGSKSSPVEDGADPEIVTATDRIVDNGQIGLRFARGREGTTQRTIAIGDWCAWTIMHKWLNELLDEIPSIPAPGVDDDRKFLTTLPTTTSEYSYQLAHIYPTVENSQDVNFSASNEYFLTGYGINFRGGHSRIIYVFMKTRDGQIQEFWIDVDLMITQVQNPAYSGDNPTADDAMPRKFVVYDAHQEQVVVPGSTDITTANGDTVTVPFETETQNRHSKETTIFFAYDDCDEQLLIAFEDVSILPSDKRVQVMVRELEVRPG